jgi:isoamyl acetate esterase
MEYVPRPTILLFGDSLTQMGFGDVTTGDVGWVSLLSSAYQRRADVLNRGYSGYNTRHALDLIPRVFGGSGGGPANTNTLFCTVFLGANDHALPGERQHVPKDEYASNLSKIVTRIRQHYEGTNNNSQSSEVPIIIFSPPPVDQVTWKRVLGLYDHFDRSNDVSREYGLAAKGVANDLGCPFLDTWELLGGNDLDTYRQHLSDGLHLSSSGNRLLYEGLMNLIQTELSHLSPSETDDSTDGIQVDGTLWSDLC